MNYLADMPFDEMVWLSFYKSINKFEVYSYFNFSDTMKSCIVGIRSRSELESDLDENIENFRNNLNSFLNGADREKQILIDGRKESIAYFEPVLIKRESEMIRFNQRIDDVKNWNVPANWQLFKEKIISDLGKDDLMKHIESIKKQIAKDKIGISNVDLYISGRIKDYEDSIQYSIKNKADVLKKYDEHVKQYAELNALIPNPWAKS